MMMQRIPQIRLANTLYVVMLSVSLLAAGCTSLPNQRQDVATRTYLLQIPENIIQLSPANTASCLTVMVNTMRAAPGFSSTRIAYKQKDYQLDYFARHQWAETPANMLTAIFTRALEDSDLFRAVVKSPSAITADIRLDSELISLQQVFHGGSSIVELQLRVLLVEQTSRSVVASHTISISETAPENTPYGGVVAANRAVELLASQLVNFVREAMHEYPENCQG